jgi:3-oxoacyl-[acyl-carrier-protein] synthase I
MLRHSEMSVVAAGARTSLGFGLASSAAAARAGLSNFAQHPFMIDRTGRPMVVALDAALPPELDEPQRLAHMAASVAWECLAGIQLDRFARKPPLLLLLALGEADDLGHISYAAEIEDALRETLADRVQVAGVSCVACAHVGGIVSIIEAGRAIEAGFDGLVLIVGTDTWMNPPRLEWLDATGQLHSDANLFGFVPGEAAASLLIATKVFSDGMFTQAWLASAERTTETQIDPAQPRLGGALSTAARAALDRLGEQAEPIDAVFTDLNGVPGRADEIGYTLVRMKHRLASNAEVTTPAEWFGDVGAATVPLMVALAISARRKRYSAARSVLLLVQSPGSERGAAIFRLPEEPFVS